MMRRTATAFGLALLAAACVAPRAGAQAAGGAAYGSSGTTTSNATVTFTPVYRYLSTTGFAGRVGEYDALKSSAGGEVALSLTDSLRHTFWNVRGSFLSYKDYDLDSRLRAGSLFTLTTRVASFVRHPDHVPFGRDLDPDNIRHDDFIPGDALLGVSRTRISAEARLKIPNTPLRAFALGDFQERKGQTQLQFFDMGATPDTATCDGCHQVSRVRDIRHVTSHFGAGLEMLSAHATLAYQHDVRILQDKRSNPLDSLGTARSIPGEDLGAPDVLAGLHVHNVLPGHRSVSETFRVGLRPDPSLSANGSLTIGRTRNAYTGHEQKYLNGDIAANWRACRELRTTLEYHQQHTDNEFTPAFERYRNPSLHRYWVGTKLDWTPPREFDVELRYRYASVTRPNAPIEPDSAYSPDNRDLLPLAHETTSNTVGLSVGLHRGATWSARSGYEYVDMRTPGYLTDAGKSHRVFLSCVATPGPRIMVSDDLSLLAESAFPTIERRNRLVFNTASAVLRPVDDWALTLLYAYAWNDLKTDLIYASDPDVVRESLVPFLARSHTFGVTSSWVLAKRLEWVVEARRVDAMSRFTSQVADTVVAPPVQWASAFSRVSVPQNLVRTDLDYRWPAGFETGARFQYAEYRDAVHSELDGVLRSYTVYLGKTW